MDLALVARLLVAHERELREVRQRLDIDVLLAEPHAKAAVQQAVAAAPEGPGIRVAAFKAVVGVLRDADVPGSTRLSDATDADLGHLLLRFRARHREPIEGRPWKWTLSMGPGAPPSLRDAVADLAISGGCPAVLVRRPLLRPGAMAEQLAEHLDPGKGAGRKGGKRGKGGQGGKGGKEGGRGRGKGGKDQAAPAPMQVEGGVGGGAPAASGGAPGSAGVAAAAVSYTGGRVEPPTKKQRSPTPERR